MEIEWTLPGADVVDHAGNTALSIAVGWCSKPVLALIVVLGRLTDLGDRIRCARLQMAVEDIVGAIGRVEIGDDHGFPQEESILAAHVRGAEPIR